MATLLDDFDPYGAQSHHGDGHDRRWRESTPDDAPASPIRLLDLSFLAAVTPPSPERSALIDFSVSPPPPLYPSSKPSAQPDMAPVHLLDDSFAVNESPIRVGSNSDDAAGPQAEEKENRPLARPARKRWSVMTKLREEQQQNLPRQSSPPVKDLSPFRAAGDASVFLSPSQLGVVDLSLIADEGASFLAVADTSETAALSRLGSRAVRGQTQKEENFSGDSSGGGQSGGMSVLLRGFAGDASATAKENDTGRDPALAQSSILPTTLTSSHRRALQQSVAHFGSPPLLLNEPTFSLDDPSSRGGDGGEEVTLLNCSTASFKDYRDLPRKPRLLLRTHAEDWSLEEEEEEEEGSRPDGGDEGKTPRPPRRRIGRVSDATTASSSSSSDGDSFRLDKFQTSGFGTGILNQSPPTAAIKPESTGTLRLELGLGPDLGGLDDAFASPPREGSSVSPPPVSPVTELASSTRTVMAPSRSSSRASTVVVEGDLLGVDDALARSASSETETETTTQPPRVPVVGQSVTTAAAKAMSGAERLKRRLEELRAQKLQRQTVPSAAAEAAAPTAHASTRTRASTTTPAATIIASTLATPAAFRRSFTRPSLGPAATATTTTTIGRLARPRLSALPTSSTSAPPPPPATPGERKESTAARLERLRSERKERETIRSAGATTTTTTTTPGRAGGGGLVRSASLIAPRERSLASFSLGGSSNVRSGARLPASQSLADLSSTASRRTSLLPAPAPTLTAGRRTSLAPPSSEVPRRRMSLAPESSAPPPARSSRQSLAPTSRNDALERSLPPSSSSASRAPVASIRRSSSLQQISEPVAGRRGSFVAAMKPTPLAPLAPAHDRTPFKFVQAQTPSNEMAASRDAPTTKSGIARAPSTRRLSRLARPSMGSLGPR